MQKIYLYLKACVRYICIFQQKNSLKKTMKNTFVSLKTSFVLDIITFWNIFLLLSFPLLAVAEFTGEAE